jgi:Tat protein secretion system quality control protein TatD with DNase activity
MDEIAAGEVGLDPAAVIKSQHGPHLGAIDLQKVVFINHDNLAKSQKYRHCERSEAISYFGT